MESLQRWKHSVVNIELRQNRDDYRISGTAIFVSYKKKYFLITVAHLLNDKTKLMYFLSTKQLFRIPLLYELNDEIKRRIITKNLYFDDKKVLRLQVTRDNVPFGHDGEEIAASKSIQLTESDSIDSAVTVHQNIDLAIISLRPRLCEFATRIFMSQPTFGEELLMLGYQPIAFEEIAKEPIQEGEDIFTVGFPEDISQIKKQKIITEKYEEYFSDDIVLPSFTFGKVSMASSDLDYFWGDLRIYWGNSGCPVISNNKLIGVVTRHAVLDKNDRQEILPFAKIVKANFIPELLEEQIKKDEAFYDVEMNYIRYPNFFYNPDLFMSIEERTKAGTLNHLDEFNNYRDTFN